MSSIRRGEAGWVYIARCDTQREGILKIGASTNPPDQRAKQLTASTSAATAFHILYSRKVADCTLVEQKMHEAFSDRRVNESREFFAVSVYEAGRTLDALAGETFSLFKPLTPFAELFATFRDDNGEGRELTAAEQRACRELEGRMARR